jgi:hypothetical protein
MRDPRDPNTTPPNSEAITPLQVPAQHPSRTERLDFSNMPGARADQGITLDAVLNQFQIAALGQAHDYSRAVFVRRTATGITNTVVLLGECHFHSREGIAQGLEVLGNFPACFVESGGFRKHLLGEIYGKGLNLAYEGIQPLMGEAFGLSETSLIRFAVLTHTVAKALRRYSDTFTVADKDFRLREIDSYLSSKLKSSISAGIVLGSAQKLAVDPNSFCMQLGEHHQLSKAELQTVRKLAVAGFLMPVIARLFRIFPNSRLAFLQGIQRGMDGRPSIDPKGRDRSMFETIISRCQADISNNTTYLAITGAYHLEGISRLLQENGGQLIFKEKAHVTSMYV